MAIQGNIQFTLIRRGRGYRTSCIMKSVIKYRINEIVETQAYDSNIGKTVPQKEAKMSVIYTSNPQDPDYCYGQLSSGSTQSLKTINPDVYKTWQVGGVVTQEMEVSPAE
jgi:hypothetical protein